MTISNYLESVVGTIQKLDKEAIENFATALLNTHQRGGVVYIFGNGGSGATASHFCGDLIKGASHGLDKRFKAICLSDNVPGLMAISNDISYDDIFIEPLKNFLTKNDLVIGLSGSGNSANVIKAFEYANKFGAQTIGLSGFRGGKLKEISSLHLHADIDDMEISEDVHHTILHCVKKVLMKKFGSVQMGEKYDARIT